MLTLKKLLSNFRLIDLFVWIASSGIFFYIFITGLQQDIRSHLLILQQSIELGFFPVPPLYYFTIYVLSGFIINYQILGSTAIIVLGAATMFKFKLTGRIVSYLVEKKIKPNSLHLFSICLLILVSIVSSERLYLGEPTPNIWHNSTTVFLMPFALLLFYKGLKIAKYGIENQNNKWIYFILILVNVLIKPSFLFVFSFLPIVYFFYHGLNKTFWFLVAGSALATLSVLLEMSYLYLSEADPFLFDESQEKNEISIDPFAVWSHHSKNIFISFMSSIVFPLAVVISKPKVLKQNLPLVFAWVQFLIAIVIFSLFIETGFRKQDANFGWQIIPSLFILFVVSLATLFNNFSAEKGTLSIRKMSGLGKFNLFLFFLHVLSGVLYLSNIFVNLQYR